MKAAKSVFFRWISGMKPDLASSASRRSLMAISVGHFIVDAAVVGREGGRRQPLDRAAAFHAADARGPAIRLEGAVMLVAMA